MGLAWLRTNRASPSPRYSTSEPHASSVANRRSSPTAFLDGLRGVAAFIVLIHHFSKDPFPWLPWGWGSVRNDVTQHYLLQLPMIRVIHSGPSMVAVFFVISGFALAYSPLKQIRRKNQATLAQKLGSSVFRRVLRLYLPCVVTTFFMMLAVQLHAAPFPAHRPREKNVFLEIEAWVMEMWKLLNPFALGFYLPRYDDNLWTIPAEFRGSMVVYLTVLAVSRMRFTLRLVTEGLVTAWLFSYGLWDVSLFTVGLLLAEIHLERLERADFTLPRPNTESTTPPSRLRRISVFLLFLLSIHLASAPLADYDQSFGYAWLAYLRPSSWRGMGVEERFIPTLAAPLLVYCVERSTRLRSVFTSSVAAYLGRISFGLYLVHGPVRYTGYHPLLRNIMGAMGLEVRAPEKELEDKHGWLKAITWIKKATQNKETAAKEAAKQAAQQADTASLDWRFIAAVAISWAIVIPVIVVVADFFSRTIDDGSIALAKKIEHRFVEGGAEGTEYTRLERSAAEETPKEWSEVREERNKHH